MKKYLSYKETSVDWIEDIPEHWWVKKLKHSCCVKARADEKEARLPNITYTQAGVSCFVGQESSKFKVQFFVGSLVVKIPACV